MTRSEQSGVPSDLKLRALVGVILASGAVVAIVLGGGTLWVVMSAVGIGMVGEWARLVGLASKQARLLQFTLAVPLAVMAPRPLGAGAEYFTLGLLIGAAMFALATTRRLWAAVGVFYVGLPVLGLLLIRDQPRGLLFCFWTFTLVWACDVGAYFAGRALGGARLAPAISPNKTWAGLVGGVLGAAALGAVFHHFYGLPWRLTLATPALALVAQSGDLFESWLKRRAGVKDSGTLLPGHGGLLDRLDGLAPVAPIAAFLVMLPQVKGFWA